MSTRQRMTWLVVGVLMGCGAVVQGTNRYVSLTGTSSSFYTNWAIAATNIQDAVDVSGTGDIIYITNGTYTLTQQVSIAQAITLEGFNGSSNTFINGNYPNTTNRCFFLTNGASLIGFTLTNGYSSGGGGVDLRNGGIVSNCVILGNSSSGRGGGARLYYGGTVNNCTLSGNTAGSGGGASIDHGGIMNNCTLSGNTAGDSGGVFIYYGGTISNCTVTGNTASTGPGGGVYLYRYRAMYNCLVVNNDAYRGGGGVRFFCDAGDTYMYNCTVVGNTARFDGGGGVYFDGVGGAAYVYNSIVWKNTCASGSNINSVAGSVVTYTCSGPAQTGAGNIGDDPLLNNYRLTANSPCLNTGMNQTWMTNAVDLDGHRRIDRLFGRVDMGAYEFIHKITLISGH